VRLSQFIGRGSNKFLEAGSHEIPLNSQIGFLPGTYIKLKYLFSCFYPDIDRAKRPIAPGTKHTEIYGETCIFANKWIVEILPDGVYSNIARVYERAIQKEKISVIIDLTSGQGKP